MYKKMGGLWKSEIKEGRSQQEKLYHFNIQTLEGLFLEKLKTGQGHLEIKVSKLENPHTKSVSSSLRMYLKSEGTAYVCAGGQEKPFGNVQMFTNMREDRIVRIYHQSKATKNEVLG